MNNQQGKRVGRTLDALKAAEVWKVLNGEVEGTKDQQAFATRVKAIYFNPATAPTSWKSKQVLKEKGYV